MQNLARDEAGNVWELDAQGNAVRVVTPAAPATGRVFSLAPNPREVARDQRQAERDAAAAQDRAADNARADRAEARAERAEARAAEQTGNSGPQITARQNAEAKVRAARSLRRQLAQMREIYERSFEGAGPIQSTIEMLPTADAQRMRAIARNMRADLKPLIRGPGEGTFTEGDQALLDQLIPDPRAFDSYNEQLFEEIDNRISGTLRQFGVDPVADAAQDAVAGHSEQRADNEVVDPTTGAQTRPTPAETDPNAGLRQEVATGDGRTFDPRTSSQIDAMINAGASKAIVDAALRQQGLTPISQGEWDAAQAWRANNPGQRYFGANVSRDQNLNVLQEAAGSPIGAFLGHLGNMGSAGIVPAIMGPDAQGALDASAALNPNASFLGSLAGGITGAGLGEAAVAARAPGWLAPHAARLGDTLYGAATGFNTAREGEGAEGAAMGAGGAFLGNWLGQRAMSGLGRLTRGVNDPNVHTLRDAGIPMTVGQVVGNSGRIGAAVKSAEDALTSVPGVGSVVDARRMEGLRGFSQAAFQRAAPPGTQITATGAEGMGQLRQGVSDAYDAALNPARIDASDPAFIADIAAANAAAARIPDVNGARTAADAALDARITGAIDPMGGIPGRNFQEAYRGLARTGRERAAGDYGHEIGQVMRQGQDALGEALERQNPGAFEGFLEANAAHRRGSVLANALRQATNQSEELITPAQLNRADVTSTSRLEGAINSASGNRPFYDLATAGQAVLPSRLPDSGTATRALVGGGVTGVLGGGGAYFGGPEGAATGTAGGLGAMLLLAAGGSRPAQRALTTMLLARPDPMRRLGNVLFDNIRLGGMAGAGAGAALTTGN